MVFDEEQDVGFVDEHFVKDVLELLDERFEVVVVGDLRSDELVFRLEGDHANRLEKASTGSGEYGRVALVLKDLHFNLQEVVQLLFLLQMQSAHFLEFPLEHSQLPGDHVVVVSRFLAL